MSLFSKSFLLDKTSNVSQIDKFLYSEIGYNAYLVQSLEANIVNDAVTQVTVFYKKYSDDPIESFSPREGSYFVSGQASDDFDIRLLFNEPIDYQSITDSVFDIDGTSIPIESVKIDLSTNNYFLKLSVSGVPFQNNNFHSYKISNQLKRRDGSFLGYSPLGGYVFGSSPIQQLGDIYKNYTARRRGIISFDTIKVPRGSNPQSAIDSFLSRKGIKLDRLLFFTTTIRTTSIIDIFFIYIAKLEAQVINGFPLNNSIIPSETLPEKLTFVFSEELDRNHLLNTSNLFSVESGFETSTPIPTNKITLHSDNKTVDLDISSYFVSEKPYTVLIRPGIKTRFGFIKEKPEQWTVNIGPTSSSGIDSLFHAHTGDVSIHYQMSGINITASQISDFTTAVNNVTGPLTGVVTGHSHFIAYSGVPPAQYQSNGMLWLDTSSSRMFLWYIDEDSSQWVQIF